MGSFDGNQLSTRIVTEKIIVSYNRNQHYCLIWSSDEKNFRREVEKIEQKLLKDKLIVFTEYACMVEKDEFKPKKTENQVKNVIVSHL